MKRLGSPRITLGIYAFSVILIVAVISAFLLIPRYLWHPPWLNSQASLVQVLLNHGGGSNNGGDLSAQTWPAIFVAKSGRPVVRGKVAIYDQANVKRYETPDVRDKRLPRGADREPPRAEELANLTDNIAVISAERVLVRSDNGGFVAVFTPFATSFPWEYFAPFMGVVLVLVLGASWWFARRMVRPLSALASAAGQFGHGDLSVRTDATRPDEFGDLGRAFNAMADRLQRTMAGQRQLLADVSHELRTPMARIRVALELATEDPAAAREMIESIAKDLAEVEGLIDDILTTSRLDGELSLRVAPITIGDLLERCRARFAEHYPGRVLEIETPGLTPAAHCDGEHVLLRRALDNLLDNAARYSEAPSPVKLTVTAGAVAADAERRVTFAVQDRGIGMTAQELTSAFTPFWRADASRQRRSGGTGLGLALARRIAQAHGGDIELQSAPGRGTRAVLSVPAVHASQQTVQAHATSAG